MIQWFQSRIKVNYKQVQIDNSLIFKIIIINSIVIEIKIKSKIIKF